MAKGGKRGAPVGNRNASGRHKVNSFSAAFTGVKGYTTNKAGGVTSVTRGHTGKQAGKAALYGAAVGGTVAGGLALAGGASAQEALGLAARHAVGTGVAYGSYSAINNTAGKRAAAKSASKGLVRIQHHTDGSQTAKLTSKGNKKANQLDRAAKATAKKAGSLVTARPKKLTKSPF
jgi:hypothetical protein